MPQATNLARLGWLQHGFGQRDSACPSQITTLRQIHSAKVVDAAGRRGDRIEEGDALISGTPGLNVGIRTADCVPILIADARLRVVAALHAGWRGTAAGIVAGTLLHMKETFGSQAGDLVAAVGPCIGACCYEVGPEVARQFGRWCPELEQVTSKVKLDLAALHAMELRRLGVTDVWVAGECTFCLAERYYSFRREREEAGRMLSYAGVT